jgi:hypothetical protein
LPQGLPKKIKLHLLLADLALQRVNALARRRKVLARLKIEHPKALARPTRRPQRRDASAAEIPAPLVQVPARNLKLT